MRRFSGLAAAVLLSACATPVPVAPNVAEVAPPAGEYDYDILIKGGTIYDGSGGKPYVADIGVKNGRINAVYPKLKGDAAVEIDARGKAVAPGFIDLSGAGDIAHGVTTAATCNQPAAPSGEALPLAILHLTSEPAARLGLKERGRLMPGWAADLVVFEPKAAQLGVTAMEDVVVDGVLVVEDGRLNGRAPPRAMASCPGLQN